MQQSVDVRDAMLRFYDRLSAGDVASFDQLVSRDPATSSGGGRARSRVIDRRNPLARDSGST